MNTDAQLNSDTPDISGTTASYLIGFTNALKQEGLNITPHHTATMLDACNVIRLQNLGELYWAGMGTLIESPDNIEIYRAVFDKYFRLQDQTVLGLGEADSPDSDEEDEDESSLVESIGSSKDQGDGELTEGEVPIMKASAREALKSKGLYLPDCDEASYIRKISALVSRHHPVRETRRFRQSKKGKYIDLRHSIADSLKTDGELIKLARKRKHRKKRSILVLVDISGSMAMHLRANIYFCYALTQAYAGSECFCVGTRLTRISKSLRSADIGMALNKVSKTVLDWNGGTRLGDGVRRFIDHAEQMNYLNGAEVFIVSDGLERGDPMPLISGVRKLSQRCKRVHWLSPLASGVDYRPTTRAMAGITPIVGKIHPGAQIRDLYYSLETIWSRL